MPYHEEPIFANEADEKAHEALLARGYRYWGWHDIEKAWLYGKRFREKEASHHDPDKCVVNVWRYDSRYLRADLPIMYEIEIYWNGTHNDAGKLKLYTFAAEVLIERLAEYEPKCISVWEQFSRKHYPESEGVEQEHD